jgi:uncharacterized membrane protein
MKQKLEKTISTSLIEYVFSQKAFWYWGIIGFSIVTTISVFTIPEATYPITYVRNLLGIIFILILPGYAFIKALFLSTVPFKTNSEKLDNFERIALSMALSLVIVPLVGLILNFSPFGIRLVPITLSLLAFTIIFATAAVLREYRVTTHILAN